LVLNHDEETWGCPKIEVKKKKGIFIHTMLGRVRGVVGTCGRKP